MTVNWRAVLGTMKQTYANRTSVKNTDKRAQSSRTCHDVILMKNRPRFVNLSTGGEVMSLRNVDLGADESFENVECVGSAK